MSEVVLNDASMKQFQANYQEQFGRPEGHDPLFEAVGQGRRLAGMEHWLPLFYGRTETLCEYLPGCPVSLDEGAEAERDDYLDQIADAFQARKAMGSIEEKAKLPVFRPLPPEQVFIDAVAWDDCLSPRAVTVFQAAPPEAGAPMEDAGARPGPRFHGDDGADALKAHLEHLRGEGARVLFAVERDAQHGPMKRRIGDTRSALRRHLGRGRWLGCRDPAGGSRLRGPRFPRHRPCRHREAGRRKTARDDSRRPAGA